MSKFEELKKKPEVNVLLGLLHIADEEAYNHSMQVAEMVNECLQVMKKQNQCNWTEKECDDILIGSMLLDIGKAYLPFGLQHNSQKLGTYERAIMNMHPILGCEAIQGEKKDENGVGMFGKIVDDVILMHHANADGTGYPVLHGKVFIAQNQEVIMNQEYTIVPDYVWLVSYTDRFIAMTRPRTYKEPMNYNQAWQELNKEIEHHKLPHLYSNIFKQVIKSRSIIKVE